MADDLYAIVAEFNRAEALMDAARQARAKGFTGVEAFSPFPIEGMEAVLDLPTAIVPWATTMGGAAGAAIGFGMQVWINFDFPLNVGGRPLVAWPAFILITFELAVLGAVVTGILAMLIANRLPRLHHPLFELPDFHFATDDRFFLALRAETEGFDAGKARAFLKGLGPVRVSDAPLTEPQR
ncbi:MAG TPA: DUF3341 domain-containing protein [Caulobacteraceae bacterium]|nr:DUF3341 domain-containing protein [Caulobacteraceae bacterium]